MPIFTAFCQGADGRGTIWIESFDAANIEDAKKIAVEECADAWGSEVENIHLLGLAKGKVKIIHWEDLNDD